MKETDVECDISKTVLVSFYRQNAGKWRGCDWPMRFGALGLNLRGLRSDQAALIARATSGKEAAEWRRAAAWLAHVEEDALEAEQWARAAVDCACNGQLNEGRKHMEKACALEARHHRRLIWQALCEAMAVDR